MADADEVFATFQNDPIIAFEEGVLLAFDRWETLNMAVDNGWDEKNAGQNLKDEFINATIQMFLESKEKMFEEEVAEWLFEVMVENFNCEADDGSTEHTAKLLITIYDDCINKKDFTGVMKMWRTQREAADAIRQNRSRDVVQEQQSTDGSSDEQDDDEKCDNGDDTNAVARSTQNMSMAEFSALRSSANTPASAILATISPDEVKTMSAHDESDEKWETVSKRRGDRNK